MASVGHVAIGMAGARVHAGSRGRPAMAAPMLAWALLSLLPDVDVLGFAFGVRYGDPWGHRGATHSLAFAIATGAAVGLSALVIDLWRSGPRRSGSAAVRLAALATVVVASHPLLDILTDGGLGCALLWPFDDTRYFAAWTPIPVAPIGLGFVSARGAYVAAVELALFAPVLAYALWPRRPGTRQW